jgi:hypothetical protein
LAGSDRSGAEQNVPALPRERASCCSEEDIVEGEEENAEKMA